MDRPPPDPVRLLEQWMEWERGQETPGRVMANLKTSGMRDLLEQLAAAAHSGDGGSTGDTPAESTGDTGSTGDAGSTGDTPAEWTPTV